MGYVPSAFSLHQHPDRIFKEPCQRLHELRCLGSVADALVNGDDGFHVRADLGCAPLRLFSQQAGGQCDRRACQCHGDGTAFFCSRSDFLELFIADVRHNCLSGQVDLGNAALAIYYLECDLCLRLYLLGGKAILAKA